MLRLASRFSGNRTTVAAICQIPVALYVLKARSLHLDDDQSTGILDKIKSTSIKQAAGAAEQGSVFLSWSGISDKLSNIADSDLQRLKLPSYATRVPEFIEQVIKSFRFEEGSIGANILNDAQETTKDRDAHVRLGSGLCDEERSFLRKRSQLTKAALAKYIDVPEADIHDDDVPIIGVAGSGGGLRACLATASYYEHMKHAGLLDTTTYLAAVSGSTWAQTLFMTLGRGDPSRVLEHLKKRLDVHIADPVPGLDSLMDKVTGPYLLRGILERYHQGYKDFGLVDLYGLMLTARLLTPNNQMTVDDADLHISSQARAIADGQQPMPIYTCVRHEIPEEVKIEAGQHNATESGKVKEMASKSFYQYFEITPYEFGSEELSAYIPTWAMGRTFANGVSTSRTPEVRLTTLVATFSSAFCASLGLYWKEVKPLVPNSGLFKRINDQISEREEELKDIHLIDGTDIANYTKGLSIDAASVLTPGLTQRDELELCDAGMDNNLPLYCLLRRDCDVIIAIDSSADIETTPWFERTEGYVKQRKIKGWPVGAGWPKNDADAAKGLEDAAAIADSKDDASEKLKAVKKKKYALDSVNIWVGQSTESDASETLKARRIQDDLESVTTSTGIMLVYLPLLPHTKYPDVDPASTDYLSTWNFVYSGSQIDSVRDLTKAHFDDGAERIRRAIRAIYERKRDQRLRSCSQQPD